MLYHFLVPLSDTIQFFNIFRYLTFRTGGAIMTAEQQAELENFRKKSIETRKELKDVRKTLREETETLQLWTKIINIGLVPLLVMLLGVGLAIVKRRKAHARIRAS